MLRRALLLGLAALATLPVGACDDEADAQAQWYDPQALLDALRPPDRRRAVAYGQAHGGLDALPFYEMDIGLADDQSEFEMTETVWYTNTTGGPLDEVVLRIYANAVGEQPRVELRGSECLGAACRVDFDGRSAITFRLAEPLAAGAHLRMRLELGGELQAIDPARTGMLAQAMEGAQRMGAGGAMHGEYGLLAQSGGTASLGNFYAQVAERRDGAWVRTDDSTMGDLGGGGLAHFKARLRCARGSRVAMSGAVVREQTHLGQGDEDPGHHEVVGTLPLARNFAIVVSPTFRAVTREVNGVTVRSWYQPRDQADGEAVLAYAVGALEVFERRFGRYPYADLDLVQAPLVGGAGGVEFSGLVTIAQMFYGSGGGSGMGVLAGLMRGAGTGNMRSSMLEFVVAHEVAHQWWHGLVGSDARQHPFVDESLAQFSAIQYMRDRYGNERAEQEAARQVAANYHFMRMQGITDGRVDRPVAAFANEMAYAGLVYGKGAFVYDAVREEVGDRRFFAGMNDYVEQHRFRTAPSRALFDRLARGDQRAAVRRLERRWLEETHGDEDLGRPDMSALMGQWMGADAVQGLGGMLEQLMQGLGQGLNGGGNLPPPPTAPPGSPAQGGGQADPEAAQALEDAVRLLRNLGN
ncbi:MAG TPA: M1 family aminopeptidase [Polyangiaceae bacterium LLY-WYZ-15_(1-7)]|nr:hypothetical protein [Sandaracinus sp.]HJK99828.1 M1 family aminopeptidase [Polyangiaceae bacterium LLY-WYZ-15_(1-7)]HJL07963.1 M1 family aminopeptidase [Polyangiaceae bacterium LLY-WYZ-15_(1-7)]HJL44518.1 M1 family aminopeptidase [Polyangiaceae bacterium LLY-WYZ-15_(1-7)]